MRTTVDLPDDVHRIIVAVAKDRNASISSTIAGIVARAVRGEDGAPSPTPTPHPATGFPRVSLPCGPITTEDVRSLDDE